MGLPELKEEKGGKVYWCVKIKWWEKVKKVNAWKPPMSVEPEEVYASSIDVRMEMTAVPDTDRVGEYVPTTDSAVNIRDAMAKWQ